MDKQIIIVVDKVECIDDSHKPNDIKQENWVKKGEIYTPIGLYKSGRFSSQNEFYFKFSEISTGNPLYGGYNIKRFSVPQSILNKIEKGEFETVEV